MHFSGFLYFNLLFPSARIRNEFENAVFNWIKGIKQSENVFDLNKAIIV